ncbi:site-specific integrase, partial [Halobacterium salinarum]|nr:site-specific integrase [Halobacterium salinarum]
MTDSLSESTGADAVDEITAWVSSKSLAGTSKDSYYNAFRKFASVMLDIDDADDLPERFAALKTSHATNSPTPSASDILRWSDVTPLIEAR